MRLQAFLENTFRADPCVSFWLQSLLFSDSIAKSGRARCATTVHQNQIDDEERCEKLNNPDYLHSESGSASAGGGPRGRHAPILEGAVIVAQGDSLSMAAW